MYYTKAELRKAADVITSTAKASGVSEAEVRAEMLIAMDEGRNNPDPSVQAKWATFRYSGPEPTAEEFIAWCTRLALGKLPCTSRESSRRNETNE